MPATPSQTESRAAERMLAELLKSWSSTELVDPVQTPQQHVFGVAFLPAAAYQAPRLPTFRMTAQRDGNAGLAPTLGRLRRPSGDAPRGEDPPRGRTAPTFDAVAKAVEAEWATDVDAGPEAAELAPEAAQASVSEEPAPSDEGRFAARVVALEAAGVLDLPATRAGGSPAPAGYADRYGQDEPDDTSGDHLSALSAIVDLDPRLGDLVHPSMRNTMTADAFDSDDEPLPAPPRSIFL